MVGNSSSGLIEAPSFELPVVNIGDRQRGRLRAINVIDVGHGRAEIAAGIARALDPGFRRRLAGLPNPYGDGRAAPSDRARAPRARARTAAHPQALHRSRVGRLTLGFLVLRKGFLKVMGATIQAALERGHDAVLIWDPVEPKPGEGGDGCRPERLAPRPTDRVGASHAALAFAPGRGVGALLAPSLHYVLKSSARDEGIAAIRRAGIGLYSLDYVFETVTSDPAAYRVIDITFT